MQRPILPVIVALRTPRLKHHMPMCLRHIQLLQRNRRSNALTSTQPKASHHQSETRNQNSHLTILAPATPCTLDPKL